MTMKHFYKTIFVSITMLVLHVTMVMGASITYSLTTHVDHRTITGTASVNSGASLENGMPRALWRAYCTYKYYSDAELTQEITVAPAEIATVYVDYVFEPPFVISREDADYIQYYNINAYIGTSRWYTIDANEGSYVGRYGGSRNSPKTSDGFAFYGDAYSLNILGGKYGKYITYPASGNNLSSSTEPMAKGWQLYHSTCTVWSSNKYWPTVVIGTDDATIRMMGITSEPPQYGTSMGHFVLYNVDNSTYTFNNKNILQGGNTGDNRNVGFFMTMGTNTNQYHTIYKVLQANGKWYGDISVSKSTRSLNFPTAYSRKDNCEYDYFYQDVDFQTPFPDGYTLPDMENTVVYIRERYKWGEPYSDHWITLAVPYDVTDLASEFGTLSDGTTPAVRVLEYTALTTNAENTKYTLTFTETDKIVAHKPYLFKADEVLEGKNLCLSKDPTWSDKTEAQLEEMVNRETSKIKFRDESHEPKSPYVTMIGTYLDKELTVQSQHPDLLYFYFGYDKRYDPASSDYVGETDAEGKQMYNFYRVTSKNVTIHPFHCYFKIEGAPAGAKFMMMDNFGNEISSVEGIDADSFIQTTGRIYNINGQMMGTDLQSLPRGIYIVNGKKVMK